MVMVVTGLLVIQLQCLALARIHDVLTEVRRPLGTYPMPGTEKTLTSVRSSRVRL
jgi:hypothetical protein